MNLPVSELQIRDLIDKYKRASVDQKFSQFGRDCASETVSALEELLERRGAAEIPLIGIVR